MSNAFQDYSTKNTVAENTTDVVVGGDETVNQLYFSVCVKENPAQSKIDDIVDAGVCAKGANCLGVPTAINARIPNGELGESGDWRLGC